MTYIKGYTQAAITIKELMESLGWARSKGKVKMIISTWRKMLTIHPPEERDFALTPYEMGYVDALCDSVN